MDSMGIYVAKNHDVRDGLRSYFLNAKETELLFAAETGDLKAVVRIVESDKNNLYIRVGKAKKIARVAKGEQANDIQNFLESYANKRLSIRG